MKFVPNAVSRAATRTGMKLKTNSPSILFVAGVAGMVGTAVLASKATLKLEEVLEEGERHLEAANQLHESGNEAYSENDYRQDMIVIYVRNAGKVLRLYAPAIIVGVISIAALTKSHNILKERNAALAAAYMGLEKAFSGYRKAVADEIGEEQERNLYYDAQDRVIIEETELGPEKVQVKRFGLGQHSPYAVVFDESNKNWEPNISVNKFFLDQQMQNLNDRLKARGHVFLNEVYDELGFPRSSVGSLVGWLWEGGDGDGYIDFGLYSSDDPIVRDFVNGYNNSVLLDFNVDGVIYQDI